MNEKELKDFQVFSDKKVKKFNLLKDNVNNNELSCNDLSSMFE